MAINFPDSPTLNQVFTDAQGTSWLWDGVKWTASGSGYLPTSGGTVAGPLTVSGLLTASGGISGSGLPERGYIGGLVTAWQSNTQVLVNTGSATSDDLTTLMTLPAPLTKSLAAWAAGNGGMLDTGVLAQAWYHIHLIYNPTTKVVDVLASTSPTAPTLPSGYTKKRRIASIATAAASPYNILQYIQNGDKFEWSVPVASYAAVPGITTAFLQVVSVPNGVVVEALLGGFISDTAAGCILYISSPQVTDVVPSGSAITAQVGAVGQNNIWNRRVMTNTSAQVRGRLTTATASLELNTEGWVDTRGRFN
jgi:hypothetical protein